MTALASGNSSLLQAANRARQSGQIAEAARIYEQNLKADPDQPIALNFLGNRALNAKELATARDYLERAVKAEPGNAVKVAGNGE